MGHYEMTGEHFKSTRGYESYGAAVDILRSLGMETQLDAYLAVQIWGTPAMCREKIARRREVLGEFDLTCCFRYAGMPVEVAEQSMRTFARHVIAPLRAQGI